MRLWNYVSTFSNLSGERLNEIYSKLKNEQGESGFGHPYLNSSAAGASDRNVGTSQPTSFNSDFRGRKQPHQFPSQHSEAFRKDHGEPKSEAWKRRRRADADNQVQNQQFHQQAAIMNNGGRLPEPNNSAGILGWGPPELRRFSNEKPSRANRGRYPSIRRPPV